MARIDESRPFIPVNIAVLTVSDTRTLADDKSGDTLVGRIEAAGHVLKDRRIVPDNIPALRGIEGRFIRPCDRSCGSSATSTVNAACPQSPRRSMRSSRQAADASDALATRAVTRRNVRVTRPILARLPNWLPGSPYVRACR